MVLFPLCRSEMYDSLGKTRAVREDMDEETFVWALECVLSRAFKGSFGTGDLYHREKPNAIHS